jgi:hypothetical protein
MVNVVISAPEAVKAAYAAKADREKAAQFSDVPGTADDIAIAGIIAAGEWLDNMGYGLKLIGLTLDEVRPIESYIPTQNPDEQI